MPYLYVFKCEDGHQSEEYRPVEKRDDPMECKVCKKEAKRIFFPTPFLFKGVFFDGPPGGDFS